MSIFVVSLSHTFKASVDNVQSYCQKKRVKFIKDASIKVSSQGKQSIKAQRHKKVLHLTYLDPLCFVFQSQQDRQRGS